MNYRGEATENAMLEGENPHRMLPIPGIKSHKMPLAPESLNICIPNKHGLMPLGTHIKFTFLQRENLFIPGNA